MKEIRSFYSNRRDKLILRRRFPYEFKTIEHYTIDTLSRYYNISDEENLKQDILRYIPEHIQKNAIESRSAIDMSIHPIMSNGTMHLFNF